MLTIGEAGPTAGLGSCCGSMTWLFRHAPKPMTKDAKAAAALAFPALLQLAASHLASLLKLAHRAPVDVSGQLRNFSASLDVAIGLLPSVEAPAAALVCFLAPRCAVYASRVGAPPLAAAPALQLILVGNRGMLFCHFPTIRDLSESSFLVPCATALPSLNPVSALIGASVRVLGLFGSCHVLALVRRATADANSMAASVGDTSALRHAAHLAISTLTQYTDAVARQAKVFAMMGGGAASGPSGLRNLLARTVCQLLFGSDLLDLLVAMQHVLIDLPPLSADQLQSSSRYFLFMAPPCPDSDASTSKVSLQVGSAIRPRLTVARQLATSWLQYQYLSTGTPTLVRSKSKCQNVLTSTVSNYGCLSPNVHHFSLYRLTLCWAALSAHPQSPRSFTLLSCLYHPGAPPDSDTLPPRGTPPGPIWRNGRTAATAATTATAG